MSDLADAPFLLAGARLPAPEAPALLDAPFAQPDLSRVGTYMKGNLAPHVPAPQKVTGFLDALEAGLQISVSGLIARGEAPSKELSTDAPFLSRTAANVTSLVGDMPAMLAGAVLGGAGGAPTGPGAVVTATAGAFALPAGLRATLMDSYTKGDFKTFGEFWDRSSGIMWQTAKGWLTGAATGGAGNIARAALPAAAPALAQIGVPTAAEIAAMVTVGSALEGHAPAAQDFLDAAVVLGGVKGSMSMAARLRTVYAATGKAPAEVVADAAKDPTITTDLASGTELAPKPVTLPELSKQIAEATGARVVLEDGTNNQIKLSAVSVPDASQGQGVGSAVLSEVKAYADSTGRPVVLTAVPRSPELQERLNSFYEKNGFVQYSADPLSGAPMFGYKPRADGIPRAYAPIAEADTARQIVPGEKAAQVAVSPFDAIPQAPGEPTKPTHVNYNYINSTQDAAAAMSRLSGIYEQEIQQQRRGTVSWEQTSAETAKILSDTLGGVDTKLLMPREPGTAAGAAELLARKQMTVGAAEAMMAARDELLAKGANAGPQDQMAFLQSIERAAMIQSEFLGARAEAGRALNILKSTKVEAERAQQIQDVIAMYGGDPMTLAKMLGEINTAAGALKFAAEATKATMWEKVVEAWKAGILSGPVTHVANIMGNGVFAALRLPIDTLASGLGLIRGGPDRVTLMEPVARAIGDLQGTIDGLKVAASVMKTGEQPGKQEQFRKAISGIKGDVIRLPFRFLSAEDAVFSTMNQRGELYTLATRQAVNEGLNPLTREFRERVVELSQNPPAKMLAAAESAAERFTFNTPLGEFGQKVSETVRTGWFGSTVAPLQMIIPFIRTPMNVLTELGRMTPLAPLVKPWRDAIARGGAERDKALAELSIGTGIAAAVFMFAQDGNVSGAGNPDPGKRRVQQAAGWQPYSVKVGDTWYNYQRLQPLGTLMGLAADVAEVWDHATEEEVDKIPKMVAVAFANAVTNQTFLQGITNIVNAMSDPKRFGPKLAQQYAGSVVPALVAQPTAMLDPVVREVNSITEAVKARIPGLRGGLLPKRDPFGEPQQTRERLGAVSPVTETKETSDKVRSEAARLGVSAADAPKKVHLGRGSGKIGDVELTPDQRDKYVDVGGHLAHDILVQMVGSPGWDDLPDLLKKRAYQRVFKQAHRAAAAQTLPADLREGLINQITEKVQAELAPE